LTEEQFKEIKTLLEKINSNLEMMDSRLYALELCISETTAAGRSVLLTHEAAQ
jgi:hypothetical protein